MKKFLIIQTAFIGDVVLSTPIIEKLKIHFPDAEIDFLLRKGNEGLLKNHPKLRKVFIWNKKKAKYLNLLRLIPKVRAQEYDYVINIQRFAASGLLTLLSRGKCKIGFSKNPFSFSYNIRVGHRLKGQHESSRNLALISEITNSDYVRPKLYPTKMDYDKVAGFKQSPNYICIAPTSVWFTKQYPPEKWLELILRLPEDFNIYLLGGPSDFDDCESILQMAEKPNVINLAGELSLLESAALIKDAAMNYVNDSAPLHIASAMNAPTTAVFLSTVPNFGFGPLANNSTVVETKENLPCKPCGLHGKSKCPIGSFICAYNIDVNQFPIPKLKE